MSKKLEDNDVISVFREEWARKLRILREATKEITVSADVDGDGDKEDLISSGLKVVHAKSKIRYTIDSVSPRDIVLIAPEGTKFLEDRATFDSEYKLA